jgi:hypothetical protein
MSPNGGIGRADPVRREMKRFKKLPSPALVVACIAVAIAIGGTAVALPGRSTVNSGDIVNRSIKEVDLRRSALSPRAYALVTGDNEVDESHTRGVQDADVETVGGEWFCIDDLGFSPRHVQATVARGSVDVVVTAEPFAPCGSGSATRVRMWDVDDQQETISADFSVAFFR